MNFDRAYSAGPFRQFYCYAGQLLSYHCLLLSASVADLAASRQSSRVPLIRAINLCKSCHGDCKTYCVFQYRLYYALDQLRPFGLFNNLNLMPIFTYSRSRRVIYLELIAITGAIVAVTFNYARVWMLSSDEILLRGLMKFFVQKLVFYAAPNVIRR